jgi:UDP-N-acetylmuramate dehydrogenase
MMAAERPCPLVDRLPSARGRIVAETALGPLTWFRVGGPAEVLFRPADEADLAAFLAALPADVPVTVIGVGSNLLVRDGGVPGVVVRLGRGFAAIAFSGRRLRVGAGALDLTVALTAAEAGIAGLEFLSGVPGTIGGALRMNAGAYGRALADVLVSARAVDRGGVVHEVPREALGLGYRHTQAPEDWIFTAATLVGRFDDPAAIAVRLREVQAAREASQPIRARTGGSTFVNPPGAKAWDLIDRAGCRGLRRGGAQVSTKHCNFLINDRDATAADIEGLGEEVRRRVLDATGVLLEWEIRRIGRHAAPAAAAAP